MLSGKFKHYIFRALSAVFATALFIIMLPLTIGMTLIMLLTGVVTLAVLRHRLHKAGIDIVRDNGFETTEQQPEANEEKPPIEGSYTVIK